MPLVLWRSGSDRKLSAHEPSICLYEDAERAKVHAFNVGFVPAAVHDDSVHCDHFCAAVA